MDEFNFFLLSFTSFFTLINPFGLIPVYITMTATLTEKQRITTARKAIVTSFITVVLFAFSGQLLFNFFGISVDGLRIVGGVIFFLMGQDMLQARLTPIKIRDEDIHAYVNDISVTPLAIPMIAGPGAITNGIVLMNDAFSWQYKLLLIAGLIIILAITYYMLLGANKISDRLGEIGKNVMMRLMGLIIMVIAVEFFFKGLEPILKKIIN